MELRAVIAALRALKRPCRVELFTDSEYVRRGVTEWLGRWSRNGWLTATRQPVKNQDLWRDLNAAMQSHKVTWRWVRGHAGNELNERADRLAVSALNTVGLRGQPDLEGPDVAIPEE
jgi:ribonuclease HI